MKLDKIILNFIGKRKYKKEAKKVFKKRNGENVPVRYKHMTNHAYITWYITHILAIQILAPSWIHETMEWKRDSWNNYNGKLDPYLTSYENKFLLKA